GAPGAPPVERPFAVNERRLTVGAILGLAVLFGLGVFAAFRLIPILASSEATARDFVHAASVDPVETRDDIALVLIEETTLARFPYRSPIDRGFLAEMLASLAALDPKAIGVDLLIDQPTEEAKDLALLDVLELTEAPPIFVVTGDEEEGLTSDQSDFLAAATAGALTAQAALERDPHNDAVRSVPAAREIGGRRTEALSIALAKAAGVAEPPDGFDILFRPPVHGSEFTPRYVAGFHEFLTAEQIGGRIVLVGVLLADADRHRTPLDVAGLGDEDGALTPGVEVHAQALAHILDGARFTETRLPTELALTLLAALIVAAVMTAPLGMFGQAALAAIAVFAFAAAPALAISTAELRMPVLPPVVAGALLGGSVALIRWRLEAATRRRLREAFGKFVAPEIVREIEAEPDALRLGGERREVTCVFTDVAGFTTLCETLEPEALCELLNRYLGGASEIFVQHGGTIDKFVGDAIVGFFGAPTTREDHAAAAIRMAVALDRFATDFVAAEAANGRAFGGTRIGVHTGFATIGNFGGDLFFDYTAMGDTVNVAARLEGANKAFGGRVC
ncbi:MAG: adenylate/guanylate cyclase domain-containing protein, partial [Pseudomonadota bacterium]